MQQNLKKRESRKDGCVSKYMHAGAVCRDRVVLIITDTVVLIIADTVVLSQEYAY